MKNTYLFTMFVLLFWPVSLRADEPNTNTDFSDCVIAESVIDDEGSIKVSQALREEAQKLVGEKYGTELTGAFADRIRREFSEYSVDVTAHVTPLTGEKPCQVRLVFQFRAAPKTNVNERYRVESVTFTGEGETKVDRTLREVGQKMVDKQFSEEFSNDLAERLRRELEGYSVTVKVERGEKPDHIKVVFQVDRTSQKHHGASIGLKAPFVYHSKQGFSIRPEIRHRSRHNSFTFGLVSDADEFLERNAGLYARYERQKLGTDFVRFRIDFESYHQKFNPATESALAERPDVPGIYRARQNLAPSLSFHPFSDLTIRTGVSFQRLQIQYPGIHTETAYAGTADVEYSKRLSTKSGYEHQFGSAYGLRTATRVLDSDYVYTRHRITADYSFRKGRNLLEARFLWGSMGGAAPLFERFSLGNCSTLRGWNKFDVAPLGGTRAAHGSLEYRYSQFRIFYDAGTVWDPGRYSKVRHGIGFGWVRKNMFASLAFPVRLHGVAPVFMMGIRLGAR